MARSLACNIYVYVYLEARLMHTFQKGKKRSKLDYRVIEGTMVGYSAKHKGYTILDPCTNNLSISRIVCFDESEKTPPSEGEYTEVNRQIVYPDVSSPKKEKAIELDTILLRM